MMFLALGFLFSLFYLLDVLYEKLQKKAEFISAMLPLVMFVILFIAVMLSSLTENKQCVDDKEKMKISSEKVVRKSKTK